MIEELAVKLRAEKKEPPKPDIYIVLWQGKNQLGNGDNRRATTGTSRWTDQGTTPKILSRLTGQPRGQAPKAYEIKELSRRSWGFLPK